MVDPTPNNNPDKIELEPIAPKKYPEELEKLAKEIEEVKEGKRADFSPEFKVEDKLKLEPKKLRVPRRLDVEKKPAPAEAPADKPVVEESAHNEPTEQSELAPATKKPKKKEAVIIRRAAREAKKEEVAVGKEAATPAEEKAPEPTPASAEASADKPVVEKPAEEKSEGVVPDKASEEAEKKKEQEELDRVAKIGREMRGIPEPAPEGPGEVEPLPEPEAGEPEDPKFNPEEALNDEEFLDFLTKYPDAERVDPGIHKREIEKRYKMFGACKKLGETVGEFYDQEAGKELDLPIGEEMNKRMLRAVEREAITDPSALIKRITEIAEYGGLQKDIGAFDKQLGELGGSKNKEEALRFIEESSKKLGKEKHQKKLSVGIFGFINPESNPVAGWWFRKIMTEEERGWREQIRKVPKEKRKEIFAEIDHKIEAFAKAKAELEKVNEPGMRHRFEDLRKEIFQNFEPVKMLFDDMQYRAAKTIGDLIKKAVHGIPGIQKIETAKQYLEKLRVSHKRLAFDVLDPEAFGMQIDQRLEEIVDSLVRENIKGFKITSKPMEKMFSEFSKLISKESDAQSKQSLVVTIASAIDKTIDHLQESGRGKPAEESRDLVAKKMLLQAVKARLLAELNK